MQIQNRPIAMPTAKRAIITAPAAAPAVQSSAADAAPQAHGALPWVLKHFQDLLIKHPTLNHMVAPFTGPFVKHLFNAPAKPGADVGPAPLRDTTIEQARQIMAKNFKPDQGKVLIGISGGGKETVHAFVVSGVAPDGQVQITQALAQYSNKPENYHGVGGLIRRIEDKLMGNKPLQMQGVVTEDWSTYAKQSQRNSIVLMELDTTPEKAQAALSDLKGLVGKPYDPTMIAADPATKASEEAMYCTEISSWFVNKIQPGTIKESTKAGYPVYQVADHLRATDVNEGPLKVLYNGENRIDIKDADPFPKDAASQAKSNVDTAASKLIKGLH